MKYLGVAVGRTPNFNWHTDNTKYATRDRGAPYWYLTKPVQKETDLT